MKVQKRAAEKEWLDTERIEWLEKERSEIGADTTTTSSRVEIVSLDTYLQ